MIYSPFPQGPQQFYKHVVAAVPPPSFPLDLNPQCIMLPCGRLAVPFLPRKPVTKLSLNTSLRLREITSDQNAYIYHIPIQDFLLIFSST